MQNSKFSFILKKLLTDNKLSGAELGRKIGVSKETISQYCKGNVEPKSGILIKLANFFGVSCDYLLTGAEPEDKKESQELGLSGDIVHYLKECSKEELELINQLLSDELFYISIICGAKRIKNGNKAVSRENIINQTIYGLVSAVFPELGESFWISSLRPIIVQNNIQRKTLLSEELQNETASLEEAIKSILPPSAE